MIVALLLAAGEGRRMNHQPKALLRYQGHTFIEQALSELEGAVDTTIVVTGAFRDEVVPFIRAPAQEAFNAAYASGLMSSIQCGLRHCPQETAAVLISLVDLPFLKSADYRAAIRHWQKGKILRSMSAGKPGHPVLIDRAFFSEILEQPLSDRGCSFLFKKYPECVQHFVTSAGRIDIDSLEDYHAHIAP